MDSRPVPALADCDDPASRCQYAWLCLGAAAIELTATVVAFADVVWPLIEDLPPGALGQEE